MSSIEKLTVSERLKIAGAENTFQNKVFASVLSIGGELIEPNKIQWAIDRIEKCKGCDYFGLVTAEGLIKPTEGCTECGCPIITKPFFKKHPLGADCPLGFWDEINKKYNT